jgi:hypothetical protein
VNRDQFEARVLAMWLKTRIPMTRANLQYWTGVARRGLNKRLDELVADGVLEADVDDDGEMFWKVPGAARAPDGPRTIAEHDRRPAAAGTPGRGRPSEVEAVAALALTRAERALGQRPGQAIEAGPGQRSMVVAAALALFTGPFGWLYAGSLKETVPAALIALVALKIVPTFLLMPLLALILPASALVGALYAWQYNKTGARQTLFLDGPGDKPG